MKKKTFDFKELKGKTLSRDEMKTIVGGDVVYCTDCSGLDANSCWAKYCQNPNCWFTDMGESLFLCQCVGAC